MAEDVGLPGPMQPQRAPLIGAAADALVDTVLAVAQGLDLRTALSRCLNAAMAMTGARYGALGVLGADGELRDFLNAGIDDRTREGIGALPTGLGVLSLMDAGDEPVRVDDIAGHPQSVGFPANHPPMTTMLGAPIVVRGDLYGKLYLTDKGGAAAPQPFSCEDASVVVALAAAAGVAVENARLYESTRQRERWQRAVTAIDSAVLMGADLGDVLQMVADEARRLSGADIAILAIPDDQRRLTVEVVDVRDPQREPRDPGEQWSVDLSRRTEDDSLPDLRRVRAMLGSHVVDPSLLRGVFSAGQTMLSPAPDFLGDAGEGFGTTIALPLQAGNRTLGVLALVWDHETDRFSRDGIEVAEAFAAQAAVTLMLAESRREQEDLLVYQDRDRIARDLHDLVVQRVFATGMSLQATIRMAGLPADATVRLERAVDDLNETIREIRETIFELHSSDTATSGVRSRVLREVAQATTMLGFQPSIRFTGPVETMLVGPLGDHIVAAVREGLSNAARHARASQVAVVVAVGGEEVLLTVEDDGVGLDSRVERRSGITNVKVRATALGGSARIERVGPEGGTRLTFRAPLG